MVNSGDVDWKEVTFQVEFLDKKGQLVDAGQELKYLCVLPNHKEIGFKISSRREFPEESYIAHKVRVISARDARARF